MGIFEAGEAESAQSIIMALFIPITYLICSAKDD